MAGIWHMAYGKEPGDHIYIYIYIPCELSTQPYTCQILHTFGCLFQDKKNKVWNTQVYWLVQRDKTHDQIYFLLSWLFVLTESSRVNGPGGSV